MIPILYESTETAFQSQGLGRLTDCISCIVTEELNGVYECEFTYPVNGPRFNDLVDGRIVFVPHDDTKIPQPFEIYRRSAPLDGAVTFYCQHISYRLNNIVLRPFTAGSCVQTIASLVSNSLSTNPFTFWTDKQVSSGFNLTHPATVRSVLGGRAGSILDVYGKGEYEFDKFTVKLHVNRGEDRGEIRYGKNLISLNQEVDSTGSYNAVVPYWTDMYDEETVMLDDPILILSGDSVEKCVPLDLSEEFQEPPTQDQLRTAAITATSDNPWVLKETLTINFAQLWQSPEYACFASLERIRLADRVRIIYEKLGITARAKVVKTVYDALLERFVSMELGEKSTSLSQAIQQSVEERVYQNVPTKSYIGQALDQQTQLLKGGRGGYKVEITDADGRPQETLYLDSPSLEDAVNVLRINKNGIGFSHSGYDPEAFVSAWTIDGHFSADFIDAGTLNANLLKAGIIQSNNGGSYWNLDSGEVYIELYSRLDSDFRSNFYIDPDTGSIRIGNNRSAIFSYFDNDELYFSDGSTKYAWIAADGFGTSELSVGSPTLVNNRWRISASSDGSRLTFTRRTS